jgi:hypothetical protein
VTPKESDTINAVTKTRYTTDLGHFLARSFGLDDATFGRSGEVSDVETDFRDDDVDLLLSS